MNTKPNVGSHMVTIWNTKCPGHTTRHAHICLSMHHLGSEVSGIFCSAASDMEQNTENNIHEDFHSVRLSSYKLTLLDKVMAFFLNSEELKRENLDSSM